ncbi:hypothetical protein [Amycolatopsis palatopharyngis]|uniref:hypothetical protein n=1 Tax=Amycolatopsis palatopharyngis TaxID=187982 RepID=UPI000E22E955|nr:hypothetical protein [Amycolatopsis palatopharyngis]
MGTPEWKSFTVTNARTGSGRRIAIKTGVAVVGNAEHFAVAIDDAPPVLVDLEDGKRLAANIYVGLAEKDKRDREQR